MMLSRRGMRDLPEHDALDRLLVHPVAPRLRERLVEVRPLRALRAGAREGVAAAAGALADEELLPVHEVGRVLAAAGGQREQRSSESGEQADDLWAKGRKRGNPIRTARTEERPGAADRPARRATPRSRRSATLSQP